MEMSHAELAHLISGYGYWAVALLIGLECLGLPLPGETALLAASIYAGTTHHLNIYGVIGSAAAGAIVGSTSAFWIGRGVGYRLLLRFGPYLHLTERRIKLGQYLFMRHGTWLVFGGRFIALLRGLSALLAGMNRMSWRRFQICNVVGTVIWASLYGSSAYLLGHKVKHLIGPVGLGLLAAVLVLIIWAGIALHRHASRLEDEAERALPGPLRPPHMRHHVFHARS